MTKHDADADRARRDLAFEAVLKQREEQKGQR